MVFRVKYLDEVELDKDISLQYKTIRVGSPTITPKDRSWNHYFMKSKDIESEEYSIAYYKDVSKPGVYSLGFNQMLVIEVKGELILVDLSNMYMVWDLNIMKDKNGLDNFNHILKIPKKYNEYLYSWDSVISRIKILNLHQWHEYLEIDRVLKRENRINQILK